MGGGGGHSSGTNYSGPFLLGKRGGKLRNSILSTFQDRLNNMGMAAFGLPAYTGQRVQPYSAETNAGLRAMGGNIQSPTDVAPIAAAGRTALANQFTNLIAPDLREATAAAGGGRYSTAIGEVEGKYLGQASLDLEKEIANLGFQAQESAKQRQIQMASDINSYMAVIDPETYQKQQQLNAQYEDFKRQWEGGGFFSTIWQSLVSPNPGSGNQSAGNWNAGIGGTGSSSAMGSVAGAVLA